MYTRWTRHWKELSVSLYFGLPRPRVAGCRYAIRYYWCGCISAGWRNDHSFSSSHSCRQQQRIEHQATCEHTFARNPARICKPQDWGDIERRGLDAYIIDVDLCSRSAPANP